MTPYETFTTRERPDLHDQFEEAFKGLWPELILHDPVSREYTPRLRERFNDFDVTVAAEGQVVAGGWGVTLAWNESLEDLPDGYDDALVRAFSPLARVHDTLCVMAVAVRAQFQGQGLGAIVLHELRSRALSRALTRVIAPVRPTLKARYPLTPMAQFAQWRRPDGQHLDPWVRLHERLGARILAPVHASMIITGSVAEFEQWTTMSFPGDGAYVVPGALDLVVVDHEHDSGVYLEPHLWMRHV